MTAALWLSLFNAVEDDVFGVVVVLGAVALGLGAPPQPEELAGFVGVTADGFEDEPQPEELDGFEDEPQPEELERELLELELDRDDEDDEVFAAAEAARARTTTICSSLFMD